MDIDICVVSHNTSDLLKRFIDTLDMNVGAKYYLFTADNGSTDDTLSWLASDPRIDFLDKNENIGYGKACNDLAAAGDSPLIGFFNADVWFMSEHNLADIIKA